MLHGEDYTSEQAINTLRATVLVKFIILFIQPIFTVKSMPRNQDENGEFGSYITISFYVKYLCIYIPVT